MANNNPSYGGLGSGTGKKTGLTKEDREDKFVTQVNPPKTSNTSRGYA
ncbi:MAG: hypothetical protein J6Y15_03480 [Bacteroidaceae bacterium]|nr:hypothetical protein [Bacteroidaceae bacterium]